jgi:hypothetical protein
MTLSRREAVLRTTRRQIQVLVPIVLILALIGGSISGCAGFAEPLPSLSMSPSSVSMSTKVGSTGSQIATVTNVGASSLGVSQATVSGAGFSVVGLTLPLTLSPGQSKGFTVQFGATKPGTVDGILSLITDAQHRPFVVGLHGATASSTAPVSSVTISPASASLSPSGKVQFTAAVQGTTTNDSVTWTASTGAITPSGAYTAPATAGTARITATSNADSTISASATVTVTTAPTPPPPNPTVSSVTISPSSASSIINGKLSFAATVAGTTSDKTVTWNASLGSITATGVYAAPGKPGTATVTATSNADPTKTASAIVTVTSTASPAPVISSLSATPTTVQGGQSALLQWSTTGASTLALSGVGTVTGTSATVLPSSTTTYTLTAANASGSVSRSVTVTVQAAAPPPTAPPPSAPPPTGSLGTATVDASRPGIQIPASFMGFSHEWGGQNDLMGQPGRTNNIYRQLLRNLTAYGAGPIMIRMGGNSADSSGQPTSTTVPPMAQLATDIGAKFDLDVNLGSNNVQLAVSQAQNYVANMPQGSLEAIEIGNEPDLYSRNGDRPGSYTIGDYFADFGKWGGQISPVLPQGVKLMGPSWCLSQSLPNLPTFLAQESNVSVISQHYYGGTGTGNAPDYLLQDAAAANGARRFASSVTLAHQAGRSFRIGEMNSVAGGGQPGVSDIFASALWSVDTMFEFASVGVDGVNFHGNSSTYALFTFDPSRKFTLQSVRPVYYGALLFQQATANGAKLLPVTVTTQANLKVWATLDNRGVVRVTLINKDKTAQGDVTISLPGFGSAQTIRLSAANYQATHGVTIGGQTFDGSTDGNILGTLSEETVTPAGGVYSVTLPPTSAALLTIQP